MKKKQYITPTTVQVPFMSECLLVTESMAIDGTNIVDDDDAVFVRPTDNWFFMGE